MPKGFKTPFKNALPFPSLGGRLDFSASLNTSPAFEFPPAAENLRIAVNVAEK